MSRSTQEMGLSSAAWKFLQEKSERIPIQICSTCNHQTGGEIISEVYDKETGENAGMFQDGSPLEKYKLKDGTWVYEVIQACPWSSGPVIFLTLVDEQKQRIPSLDWPQEEIDNA